MEKSTWRDISQNSKENLTFLSFLNIFLREIAIISHAEQYTIYYYYFFSSYHLIKIGSRIIFRETFYSIFCHTGFKHVFLYRRERENSWNLVFVHNNLGIIFREITLRPGSAFWKGSFPLVCKFKFRKAQHKVPLENFKISV